MQFSKFVTSCLLVYTTATGAIVVSELPFFYGNHSGQCVENYLKGGRRCIEVGWHCVLAFSVLRGRCCCFVLGFFFFPFLSRDYFLFIYIYIGFIPAGNH